MKKNVLMIAGAALAVVLTGCESPDGSPNRTGSGALIGGAVGAAAGGLIGSTSRHNSGANAAAGALIGGAIGAITGGSIGHSLDQEEQARLRTQAPLTYQRIEQGQPLGIADVKAMAKAGVSDDVIISQIRSTRTVYRLIAEDIIDLNNSGVSQKVINYMINTPGTAGTTTMQAETAVVAQPPPPPPMETVVVAPGPGYVWCGGEWAWRGRWVWMSGGWVSPPYPRAIWVGGHWSHGSRGWRHAPGHWR
ncbi:MAG: YXWGXW repeat-containing protein [Verrucomicrobia bacterium]|jgi:uncharacterized protein YcfJ|nr:YXWGXW repeat-containing protein [Verrucomicrobiota bacterium]